MREFFKIAALVDVVLIFIFFNKPVALLNTQLAFIASLVVVLGSFLGYKRVVEKKSINFNDRDYIEKIEDRFDLYSEEKTEDAKELFEQEKRKVKSHSNLKVLAKSYQGFLSPLRLFGYAFMVVSVLVLIRKEIFEPGAYLIGLAVVPLSAMILAIFKRS